MRQLMTKEFEVTLLYQPLAHPYTYVVEEIIGPSVEIIIDKKYLTYREAETGESLPRTQNMIVRPHVGLIDEEAKALGNYAVLTTRRTTSYKGASPAYRDIVSYAEMQGMKNGDI